MNVNPQVEITDQELGAVWQWHRHVSDDKANETACLDECRKVLNGLAKKAFDEGREYERKHGC